ncbi:hypothetical protein MMC14_006584 [Varicellaria rhodocarpa]|nr:hypothetical protein [Varicellaria rhodocarpa]
MSNRLSSPAQLKGYKYKHQLKDQDEVKPIDPRNESTSSPPASQPFPISDGLLDPTIRGYRNRRASYRYTRLSVIPSRPRKLPTGREQSNSSTPLASSGDWTASIGPFADIEQLIDDVLHCALSPTSEHFVGPDGFPLRVEVEINRYRDGKYSTPKIEPQFLPKSLFFKRSKEQCRKVMGISPTVAEVESAKDISTDNTETSPIRINLGTKNCLDAENRDADNQKTEKQETENQEAQKQENENPETENQEANNQATENQETNNQETENQKTENRESSLTKFESAPREPQFPKDILTSQEYNSNFDFGRPDEWHKWETSSPRAGPKKLGLQAHLHDKADVKSMVASIHETSPPASPPLPPKSKHPYDKPLPPIPENIPEDSSERSFDKAVVHSKPTVTPSLFLRRKATQSSTKHYQNKSMPSLPLDALPSHCETGARIHATRCEPQPATASMYEKEVCDFEVHPAYRAEPIRAPLIMSNAKFVGPLPQPVEIDRHHQRILSHPTLDEPLPTSPLLGSHQDQQRILSGSFNPIESPFSSQVVRLPHSKSFSPISPINLPLPPSSPHSTDHDNASFVNTSFSTEDSLSSSPSKLVGGHLKRRQSPEGIRLFAQAVEEINSLERINKPRHRRIQTVDVPSCPKLISPYGMRREQGIKTYPMKRKTTALKRTSIFENKALMGRRERDSGESFLTETTGSGEGKSHNSSQSFPTTTPRSSDPLRSEDDQKLIAKLKHRSSSVYSNDLDSLTLLLPAPILDPLHPNFKGKGRDLTIHYPQLVRSNTDIPTSIVSKKNRELTATSHLPHSQSIPITPPNRKSEDTTGKTIHRQRDKTLKGLVESPLFKKRFSRGSRNGSISKVSVLDRLARMG